MASPVFCCGLFYCSEEDALYLSAGECRSGLRGSALSTVNRQRWEAVFRRERRPESLDRL